MATPLPAPPDDADRQARFLSLVDGYQGALRKLVACHAAGTADREDLFQEILLQLWRAFDSFRGEAAFSTFLYRVALNTALMGRRQRQRRAPSGDETPVDSLPAPTGSSPDDDEVEQLYAAIRGLGALDRAVLLLVLEERSHAEIAAITGLSVGNVGVRLVRARRRLRRMLETRTDPRRDERCSTKT